MRRCPWQLRPLSSLAFFVQVGLLLYLLTFISEMKIQDNIEVYMSNEMNIGETNKVPVPTAVALQSRHSLQPPSPPSLQPPPRPVNQSDRLELLSAKCKAHSRDISGEVEKVFTHPTQPIAYCATNKIASTHWIRIFRWLYNDTRTGHVVSPLNISKMDTHLRPFWKLKVRHVSTSLADKALVESSYRFLFTRNPYDRLWSVYVDKFILPDNYFWKTYSPKIKTLTYDQEKSAQNVKPPSSLGKFDSKGVRNALLRHQNKTARRNLMTDSSIVIVASTHDVKTEAPVARAKIATSRKQPTECVNVTFQEFLEYIVNVAALSSGMALDDHFRPVHYGCNPCKFRPDFIGQMETMKEDNEKILHRMHLEHVFPRASMVSHAEQEIAMLIDFNFHIVVKLRFQRHCVSLVDLEQRLVKAFVINGYITEDSERVLEKRLPLGQSGLKRAVLEVLHGANRTSSEMKAQRQRKKIEAFQEIPLSLLHGIHQVFYWDFVLFGYEEFPSEIFSRTH